MSDAGATELVRRLDALIDEARERGALAELRPALLRGLAARLAPEDPTAPPGRFGIIGASPAMERVFELLERVTRSDVPVLIQGETGTGKELVAHALHDHGARAAKPFMAENCAAVPANLLESELFGHVRGSFTGAVATRPGHFVAADGGTVFLDEIGDMPLEMQAKLLRVLQDGELRPVGANEPVSVDVRVVAATHRDLLAMTAERTFREDLYFRLNVITIPLPPLRERDGDVEVLAGYFLEQYAREDEKQVKLDPEAMQALVAWRWPGNVRELQNEIRRVVALTEGTIGVADLSPAIAAGRS